MRPYNSNIVDGTIATGGIQILYDDDDAFLIEPLM